MRTTFSSFPTARPAGCGVGLAIRGWGECKGGGARAGGAAGLSGEGAPGEPAANKAVALTTVATLAPDSGAAADTTVSGESPPLVSKTAAPHDGLEWIPDQKRRRP